ncbi:MAG: helix-hairpin-helix domain-containing protein [Candidatus Zixiibacteriota bacterium]
MNKAVRFPSFTSQETKALIFLLLTLIIGGGITLYKKSHPHFAPELISGGTEKAGMNVIGKEVFKSKRSKINSKININSASNKELENLPGIGPVLANRIVKLRESKGKFKKMDELLEVKGIGLKKLEAIKKWVIID